MSPVIITIIIMAVLMLLMVVQSVLSKFEGWAWGAIIPIIIILSAVYVFFFTKINFEFKSCLFFAIPFVWSLEEWDKGRKKLKEQKEKEIEFMKAKDLE